MAVHAAAGLLRMHDGLRLADRRSRGKHSAGHAECNAKERQQQQAFYEETSYH
jgi:hypothetical protein